MYKKFLCVFLCSFIFFSLIISKYSSISLVSCLNGENSPDSLAGHSSSGNGADSLAAPDRRHVPILMYHGLTEKKNKVNDYFILTKTFESDMEYLSKNGYASVNMTDLIRFVHGGENVAFPGKPVIITFDDGYYNNYRFASPILEKYGMKAVISVIGAACDQATGDKYPSKDCCSVTWDQLREMAQSGLWEIQNHTYDLHEIKDGRRGADRRPGEDEVSYKTMLSGDLLLLQEKIYKTTGVYPNTLAWPYGAYPRDMGNFLRDLGFNAALTCNDGINIVKKGDRAALYSLKRQLRRPEIFLKDLLEY